jgi:hypothetical protein
MKNKKTVISLTAIIILLICATSAWCFTLPVAGDFMYSTYDFARNKLLRGVPGVLITMFFLLSGAHVCATKELGGVKVGIWPILFAFFLYDIDQAVTAVGMNI